MDISEIKQSQKSEILAQANSGNRGIPDYESGIVSPAGTLKVLLELGKEFEKTQPEIAARFYRRFLDLGGLGQNPFSAIKRLHALDFCIADMELCAKKQDFQGQIYRIAHLASVLFPHNDDTFDETIVDRNITRFLPKREFIVWDALADFVIGGKGKIRKEAAGRLGLLLCYIQFNSWLNQKPHMPSTNAHSKIHEYRKERRRLRKDAVSARPKGTRRKSILLSAVR